MPDEATAGRAALLRLLRFILIIVIVLVALFYVLDIGQNPQQLGDFEIDLVTGWRWVLLFALTLGFGVIAIDVLTPGKKIATVSGVFFGLVVGILASIALSFLVDRLAEAYEIQGERIISTIKILLGIAATYLCMSIVLQTQDQFRLVIPYVEFSKQFRGHKPTLLDTSAIIDGRVLDMGRTGVIQTPILIPHFVLDELHTLSDSSDRLKRARGRRGLEIVSRLQREPRIDLSIDETPAPGAGVDQMLVELASKMPAMIMTTDTGLERVAGIQGVQILNLNDIARSLRSSAQPGETLEIELIRSGEQPKQGVGYLPDGTMVVAEDGADFVGQHVRLTVTSSLQTSAGRLIFGRIGHDHSSPAIADSAPSSEPAEAPATVLPPPTEPVAESGNEQPDSADADSSGPNPSEDDPSTQARRRDPRRTSARNPRR